MAVGANRYGGGHKPAEILTPTSATCAICLISLPVFVLVLSVVFGFKSEVSHLVTINNQMLEQLNLRDFLRGKFEDNETCVPAGEMLGSCSEILHRFPSSPSGYYSVRLDASYSVQVYCDMTLSCGGITGGWRRVAYLNVHEGMPCPPELEQVKDPLCCHRIESVGGCTTVSYNSGPTLYTHVCGRINAVQMGSLDGFKKYSDLRPTYPTIEENYVDGVSLSLFDRKSRRSHIWTFAASDCSLSASNVPSFVGSHYSFDYGTPGTGPALLWDEHQCVPSTVSNRSWIYRKLSQYTLDDVVMRVCQDQDRIDEDLGLQLVQIYVQ